MKPAVALALLALNMVLTAVAAGAADQKSATSSYDLVEASAVPSSAPEDLLVVGYSDAEGNYYLEQHDVDRDQGPPILKFDKAGQLKTTFTLPAGLVGSSFFVDDKQILYRLAFHAYKSDAASLVKNDFDRLVLIYAKDGSLKTQVKLEVTARLIPYQIGVFGSGDFLISGNWSTKHLDDPPQFYTAIFTSEGKLVKKITPAGDDGLMQPSDFNYGPGHNNAVSGGHVALASDGNLYLMRRTLPAVIYAISPRGEVVRTLYVDSDGTGLYPTNLVSREGHLAIVFKNYGDRPPWPEFLKVIDLEGNTLAAYRVDPHTGTRLLSFNSSRFTFLTQDSGRWRLAEFVPR